jgi:glutamate carboxypeptidase
LVQAAEARRDAMLALIRELVALESPSGDVDALTRCSRVLADGSVAAGAAAEFRAPDGPGAPHLVARWDGGPGRVLLLGHFDTVWPVGQLARQPLVERDGRLFGPGVYDMKAGLVIALTAVGLARSHAACPSVTFLATADEETGSATSRRLIEALAREHDAVLVFEPAIPGGAVKTGRKGVGEFTVTAHGVSSHAGADPRAGASAIHELARQVLAMQALSDPTRGLTINVGTIQGGTRSNVVAETARAAVDVRITRLDDAARIEQALRALQPHDPRVRLEIAGAVNRPPMERTAGVAKLFELARDVAASANWTLSEGATGGASDGNFTAALGVPTLDGLGATGDGAHALHEHVEIRELPRRAALVAGLLMRLVDNDIRS